MGHESDHFLSGYKLFIISIKHINDCPPFTFGLLSLSLSLKHTHHSRERKRETDYVFFEGLVAAIPQESTPLHARSYERSGA